MAEANKTTLMRSVNQEIAGFAAVFADGDGTHDLWSFVCECDEPSCSERIELPLDDYLAIRADPDGHVLAPDHVVVRARTARRSAAASQAATDASHAHAKELGEQAQALRAEAKQARRHRAERRRTRPVLYLVSSRRSGPGRRVEAWLAQVLQRRRNHQTFDLQILDPDDNPDLVEQLAVDELPAIVVVEDGEVRARLSQPRGQAELRAILTPWLR